MTISHPPFHVKAVTLLTSIVFGSIATRNIFHPGEAIFLPNDDNLQKFLFGVDSPSQLSRGQIVYSNLLGHMILVYLSAKLTTVWTATTEGTFLRRNLLTAFGITQIIMGISMYTRFETDLKNAGATFKGLSGLMISEGLIFLYDALFRSRPIKKKKNIDKSK